MDVVAGERTGNWGTGFVERTDAGLVGADRVQLAAGVFPRWSRLKASSLAVIAVAVAAGIADGQREVLGHREDTAGADSRGDPQANHTRTFLALEGDRTSIVDDGALAGTGQTVVAVAGPVAVAALALLGTECADQGIEMQV